MTTRRIIAAGLVLFVAGIVVVVVAGSTFVSAVGVVLIGFAGVVFISLLFFLVGQSEDRDAARRGGRR